MSLLKRELSASEIEELERLAASRTAQARLVERARIVLYASRTRHLCEAARSLGKDKDTIRLWGERFCNEGLAGLQDRHRCGRSCTYTSDDYAKVLETSLTRPADLGLPFGSWTMDRLSAYLHENGVKMSRSRMAEVLQAEGLRWHEEESWPNKSESLDPSFRQKRGLSSGRTARYRRTR